MLGSREFGENGNSDKRRWGEKEREFGCHVSLIVAACFCYLLQQVTKAIVREE